MILDAIWILIRVIILIVIAAIGFMHIFGAVPSYRRYKLIQKLPGPEGAIYFGMALEMMRVPPQDILNYLISHFNNYDRMMKVWMLGYSSVFLKDPDDIQVLLNSTAHITKGLEYDILRPWLNEGLLTSTGDKWRARRKMFTPAFHFTILEDSAVTFNRDAKILCEKLKKAVGRNIELEGYISSCTLDIITGTAMGISLNTRSGAQKYMEELKTISASIAERILNPFLFNDYMFYVSSAGRLFRKAKRYMHEFSGEVIDEKINELLIRQEDADRPTAESSRGKIRRHFLDAILETELSIPGTFSDEDIREEVDTFMFEGHDTTAAAILFTLFNLARNRDVQEKVYRELREIFGDSDRDITSNDLKKMNYLEKVIKESLRLFPSVPAISRYLEKDLILKDGVIIPASANVIVPFFIVHRQSEHWPDPEKFDPERFSEENIGARHPYSYVPFSAGPRNCIGQKFALMELKTVVAAVVRKFRMEAVTEAQQLNLVAYLVLRSTVPIEFKLFER